VGTEAAKVAKGSLATLATASPPCIPERESGSECHQTEPHSEDFQNSEAAREYPEGRTVIHGTPISELRDLTGDDWPEIKNDPDALDSFAHAVSTRRMRESGRRPSHYTQVSICKHCGPVWLWEGAPEHVQGCPWCFNRLRGIIFHSRSAND